MTRLYADQSLAVAYAAGDAVRRTPPTGEARQRCWGWICFAVAALCATQASALDLPSGQSVELHEVVVEEISGQTAARFRFIAPAIARDGGTVRFTDAELDMAELCEAVALPYIEEHGLPAQSIVISLADREVEFGSSDPDATQFFDAFRVEGSTCIWEAF